MPNARKESGPAPRASFADSVAELFEAHGWPRLVGRVLGELLLADPPYLSTAQLCERLDTSKGHLSSAITMLEAMRMVERFGVSGTRQHHYRLTPDAFVRAMRHAVEPSVTLANLADRVLAEAPTGSLAHHELTRMRDFYRFLARRLPELVAEFETESATGRPPSTS